MKKSEIFSVQTTPRWANYSLFALILLFTSFVTFRVVFAQTSTFENPSCNPVDDPGACNPSAPLFLNPNKETNSITPSTAGAQLVRTPLQIGYVGNGKDLDLFGNANLRPGAKLQTQGTFTGQAVDVTSTGDIAIVGNSLAIGKAGIQGNGQGALPGVWATTMTGKALLAQGGPSGKAAQFEGEVIFALASDTTKNATFGIDTDGNLNIAIAGSKSLFINGAPAAGAAKTATVTGTNGNGGLTIYDIKGNIPGGGQYPVTSIQVMYMDSATTDQYWKPVAATAFTYKECTGASWVGSLEITNPIASPIYRVAFTYDASNGFNCDGQDITAPTDVVLSGVTTNYWYSSSTVALSSTAVDPEGITKVEFYDNGVMIGVADTTAPYQATWDASTAVSTFATGTTHSLTAKAYSVGGSFTSLATVVKSFTPADNRFVCGNTITCTSGSQTCCTQTKRNDGGSPICTEYNISPPVCLNAGQFCGICGPPPPAG